MEETSKEMNEAVTKIFKILDDTGVGALMILTKDKEGGMLANDDDPTVVYKMVRSALVSTNNPLKDSIVQAVVDYMESKGDAFVAPRSKVMGIIQDICKVPENQTEIFNFNENSKEIN